MDNRRTSRSRSRRERRGRAPVSRAVELRAAAEGGRAPAGIQLPSSVELAVTETEPGVRGRHGLERDEAGDARDGRRRAGAAVRERGRPDQGRPPRRPLHQPRVAQRSGARPPPRASLVDTTLRLLGQEPLAGRMPTAELLASPRSSTAPASRTSRSPAAASSTPRCAAASRAPGSGSARSRRARRRRSRWRCAAASSSARGRSAATRAPLRRLRRRERHRRLPPPRPAQRRLEPARGGRGDHRGRPGVRRGPRLQPGSRARRTRSSSRRSSSRARRRERPPARSVRLARAPQAPSCRRARRGQRPAGRPLLPGRRRQRAGRGARGCACRRRPHRLRRLSGRAHAPPRLGGSAREALDGLGLDTGVDVDALWQPPTSSTSTSATSR